VLRVTHVINGLSIGGAEVMLSRLLACTDRERFQPDVVSLSDLGALGSEIQALDIPVRALHLRPRVGDARRIAKLVRWFIEDPPDLVQTWLYESDLIGGVSARIAHRKVPVIWGVHQSNLDPGRCKRRRIWAARACAALSHWVPTRIVCCSSVSARLHEQLGYAEHKMVVIPNGTDLAGFAPDPSARLAVRRELGLPRSALLVGLMARYDAQKDHQTFIGAAGIVARRFPDVHFVLCGQGIDRSNGELVAWIEKERLSSRCHLLGLRRDVARVTSALDVATSSSAYGEAFSLALSEAMACGVPCVVTDVGDSPFMVGTTGEVVPARDPTAFAGAVCGLLALDAAARQGRGMAARARVDEHFQLRTAVDRYQALYEDVGRPRRATLT
jgi:glycosyltransferase involved in cell wall biosynthesis